MKIIADMHCHTIGSSHAYSTIMENINYAKKSGLYAIAITDHSGFMPEPPAKWFFKNLKIIPKIIDGIRVLRGIEANVLNVSGDLDIPDEIEKPFNWVIASIHSHVYDGNNAQDCTQTWLNVAKNPYVNVIGHSGLPEYKYDYEKVIPEFGKNGKLVEINNHCFTQRPRAIPNLKEIARVCKKHEVKVVVNSDAHFCTQIGVFNEALKLLHEVNFPEELVVNSNQERLNKYLSEYTNFFDDIM